MGIPFDIEHLHSVSTGDVRVSIAVLDGPVDLNHACFEGARIHRLPGVVAGLPTRGSATEHGTYIASLIFGQPGSPVRGIAPGCTGLVVPVYDVDDRGLLIPCSQLDLARAIAQAVDAGADIINVSGGEFDPAGKANSHLAAALRRCEKEGVLVVAAAGNDGCDCVHVPAASPAVLAVGAMGTSGQILDFSNWGEIYASQGILAPGHAVEGAAAGGTTFRSSGTSGAAALVSGTIALLMSLQYRWGQHPSSHAVRDAILQTATGCRAGLDADCRRVLAGRLNVRGARLQLKSGVDMEESSDTTFEEPSDSGAPPELGNVLPAEAERATGSVVSIDVGGDVNADVGVVPSSCGCSGCASGEGCSGSDSSPARVPVGPRMAYALGQIGYDFGNEARRDSFIQHGVSNPHDPAELLAHLAKNPDHATAISWTLNQDTTPIYSILPGGAFAARGYEKICQFLEDQLAGRAQRISLPGWVTRSTTLMNGHSVPVIQPELRGMYSWSTADLVTAVAGRAPRGKDDREAHDAKRLEISRFLDRIYHELRNLGVVSADRAMNFAATNAFRLDYVFATALESELKLDSIDVERSPIARPGADCWDVTLTFFHPTRRLDHAREVYRIAVDVSDVVPVTIGDVRHWNIY